MNQQRTIRTLMACALVCCCTSTESAVAPLGFGPLASAERAQREQLPARAASTVKHKRTTENRVAKAPAAVAGPTVTDASTGGGSGKSEEPRVSDVTAPQTAAPNVSPSDWLGLWRGKDTTRFSIPSFPSEPMTDDKARIRVESGENQEIKLVLIDSSTESDLCSLSAKLQGQEAQIAPGQPCFGSEDDTMELEVQVRSGRAKLDKPFMTVELSMDAEIKSDQLQARGSVEYRFEGTH